MSVAVVANPEIERKLNLDKPYEASDFPNMPEEYKELLLHQLKVQASIEGQNLYRVRLSGLSLEEIVELIPEDEWVFRMKEYRLLADEVNHGYISIKLLADLGFNITKADFPEDADLGISFANQSLEDWVDLALAHFLTDIIGHFACGDWRHATYGPLARAGARIARDEQGHFRLGYQMVNRLLELGRGEDLRARLYDKWWPVALDGFGRSDTKRQWRYIEWGIKQHSNQQLREMYITKMTPVVEKLGFDVPPSDHNRMVR